MFTRISTPLRHTHLRIPIQPHPSITLPSFSSHTSSDEKPGKDQQPQDDEPVLGNKIKRTFKTLDGDVREFDNFIQVRPHVSYRVDGMFLDEKDSTPATRTAMVGAITFLTHISALMPVTFWFMEWELLALSAFTAVGTMSSYFNRFEPQEGTMKALTEEEMEDNDLVHPYNYFVNKDDMFLEKNGQEVIDKMTDPARWMFFASWGEKKGVRRIGGVNPFTPTIGGILGERAVLWTLNGLFLEMIYLATQYGSFNPWALLFYPFTYLGAQVAVVPFTYTLGWFMAKWICMAQPGDAIRK